MRIDVLTLFPHMFDGILNESILKRAQDKELIKVQTIDIREFSTNKHRKVDDYPYGGGQGMLMAVEPIYNAYMHIVKESGNKPYVIYMTPQGKVFNQEIAKDIAKLEHIVLLCGHYEGIDQRIIDELVDLELSIGDYVLTGGEIPAMVAIDCISRLIPDVLSVQESFEDESHFNGLLEYPQYTRPREFLGRVVPDVLLSGNHEEIRKWRCEKSLENTRLKRPDLFDKYNNGK
ncbi:MAG: tRNA (guanosine(37)-N1)-methyltransferase TrmD [Clostridiales bacterium]|nr:tRNA (guanosine(37)-N1)-methyltransferase TrmD [Clostridiales bacterium]